MNTEKGFGTDWGKEDNISTLKSYTLLKQCLCLCLLVNQYQYQLTGILVNQSLGLSDRVEVLVNFGLHIQVKSDFEWVRGEGSLSIYRVIY